MANYPPPKSPLLTTTVQDDSFYVTRKVAVNVRTAAIAFSDQGTNFLQSRTRRCSYKSEPSVLLCTMCIPFLMGGLFMQTIDIAQLLCSPERLERGGPCCLLKLRQMLAQNWAFKSSSRYFCSALPAFVGPVQNILFLTVHYFSPFSSSPSKLGRQSCWVASLLVCFSVVHRGNLLHCHIHRITPPLHIS